MPKVPQARPVGLLVVSLGSDLLALCRPIIRRRATMQAPVAAIPSQNLSESLGSKGWSRGLGTRLRGLQGRRRGSTARGARDIRTELYRKQGIEHSKGQGLSLPRILPIFVSVALQG